LAHNIETRLVHKVLQDRTIIPVLERGIKDDWILDDDLRRIWKFIREHYSTYREVPTIDAVQENYPSFKEIAVEDNLTYLIDKTVKDRRDMVARTGLQTIIEKWEKSDPEGALSEMSKTITLVNEQGQIGTTHVDLTKNIEARLELYEQLLNMELLGVPTGFAAIDQATAGLQGGQLITVIAPPKTGKSQIALRMAINTHELGKVPMFQSFEMSNFEQSQRHDAMRAHLSHSKLRRGKLSPVEKAQYDGMMDDLKEMHPFHMVDAINGLSIDTLVAKVEQLKPDILFVDGVYLMMDQVTGESNTPQALTNITRGLKRVAQAMDIPIVITTQTLLWKMRKNKVTADSIGYSSSFFQDSDVILGLEPVEDDEQLRTLKIVQARNAAPDTAVTLTWNWDSSCFHDEDDECTWCSPYSGARTFV
jgi:replicative DNA helicase